MGAPPNRLLEVMRGFKKRGYEVSIITGMPNYPKGQIFEGYRGKLYLKDSIEGSPVHRYWFYASNSKSSLPRIWSMITFSISVLFGINHVKKNCVLFVESPPLLLGISGWIMAKLRGSKFLFNISDIWPLSAKELNAISDGFLYRRLEGLEKFLYRRSDIISGQSQEIMDHIRSKTSTKTILLRNGVDNTRFKARNFDKDKGQGQIKIVYAGLLGVAQGVLNICKNVNFKSLNTEFHIYGEGSEKEELISFLAIENNRGIYYHGSVERKEIPETLSIYDCYLVPLIKPIYGAVPSKIYEAMAAGLAVLFFGDGEGAGITVKYNIGLIAKSGDFEKLIKNIEKLQEKELVLKFALNSRKTAETVFDRNVIIETFISELENELN